MSFYRESVCPCLTHLAMRAGSLRPYREAVTRQASGRVLEIGVGSGANLGFYRNSLECVIGIDPSAGMLRRAAAMDTHIPVMLLQSAGEALPLESGSFDCVVSTWTLCSVSDPRLVLKEISRVLKPGGKILFSEHGLAPDEGVSKWQRRIEPVWKPLAGGCHLTRDTEAMFASAGFRLEDAETMYLPSTPKVAGFVSWGTAVPV